MFSLMDKVPSGIEPMLKDLEEHIMSAGLADMVASAETITSVSHVTQMRAGMLSAPSPLQKFEIKVLVFIFSQAGKS